jgi:hypothetical protein
MYIAEELLRAEGFSDIRYVETESGIPPFEAVGRGEIDFVSGFALNRCTTLPFCSGTGLQAHSSHSAPISISKQR